MVRSYMTDKGHDCSYIHRNDKLRNRNREDQRRRCICSLLTRIYRGKNRISDAESHTIHYGHIMDGSETIDEVLVMVMKGPGTFTGEDTVEINCHGGTFVVKRVLETVLKNGARAAEPGEFTKRAFLNGKRDLSQAEAVIDVINSENEYALQSSVSQLKRKYKK